jgi:hypothetical protein
VQVDRLHAEGVLMCVICEDCSVSYAAAKLLIPGTPVKHGDIVGRVYGIPSTGVTHWFISIVSLCERDSEGRVTSTYSSISIPADQVEIIDEASLTVDVRSMTEAECYRSDDLETNLYAHRLGWYP